MAGNYATAGKNLMLDALGQAVTFLAVHTADPGSTGASEATGGSYSRLEAFWTTAASGALQLSSEVAFDLPAGTYRYLGLWGSYTGGVYYGKILLPSPQVYTVPSILPVAAVTLDLNATPSA